MECHYRAHNRTVKYTQLANSIGADTYRVANSASNSPRQTELPPENRPGLWARKIPIKVQREDGRGAR
jgi:hypothetical protein